MITVRRGANRTVLLIGDYAVKVPRFRKHHPRDATLRTRLGSWARGVLANQSEHAWHGYGPWEGKVAPVLASWLGGLIQVYPRCAPLPPGYRGLLPLLDPCPGDLKIANFGLLDGRIVRVDYDMCGMSPES